MAVATIERARAPAKKTRILLIDYATESAIYPKASNQPPNFLIRDPHALNNTGVTEGGTFLIPVILVVILILGIISSIAAKRRAEERRIALQALAARFGLTFQPEIYDAPRGFMEALSGVQTTTEQFLAPFQHLSPFGQGHSHEVKNLITGVHGELGVLFFDYSYRVTTSNGKSTTTTTYYVQVMTVTLPLWLPVFTMQDETFLLKIGEKFGYREVEFESEEFNQRWFVRGQDTKQIYELLHPRAMERMLNVGPYRWEFGGNMIVVLNSSYLEPPAIERTLVDITDFVNLVPKYFRQDHRL